MEYKRVVFTDDDLERLHLYLADGSMPIAETIKALAYRLKYAEELVKLGSHREDCVADIGEKCTCSYGLVYEDWERSKGL